MRGRREGVMGGFRRRAEGKSTRRKTLNVLSKANKCCLCWTAEQSIDASWCTSVERAKLRIL